MINDLLTVYGDIEDSLTQLIGGFASNVIYTDPSGCICRICGGPKKPDYELCIQCERHHNRAKQLNPDHPPLPFPIRSLVYAPEHSDRKVASQMTKYMYDYKAFTGNTEAINAMKYMLMHTLIVHRHCLAELCDGHSITAWATVPSTRGSRHEHRKNPLNALVMSCMRNTPEIKLEAIGEKTRELNLDTFSLTQSYDQSLLQHVLLIDDSWVSGGTILSAAATLKQHGAQSVTAFCIARIINLDFCQQIGPEVMERFTTAKYQQSYCLWLGKTHPLQECLE